MSRSGLKHCPYCGGPWPKSADHALRGFGWIDPLPRNVGPSNGDLFLHTFKPHDRFLFVEAKTAYEPEARAGQNRLLQALAAIPSFTVRMIRGRLDRFTVRRVTKDGVEPEGIESDAELFRRRVVDWVDGANWSDPQRTTGRGIWLPGLSTHTHGYGRGEDGVWRCLQDYYAPGHQPDTGCGETWEPGRAEVAI
jgi:hypothetical protein